MHLYGCPLHGAIWSTHASIAVSLVAEISAPECSLSGTNPCTLQSMSLIKVLVIDDREAHASGLAELLQLSGFDASYVTSGFRGLEYLVDDPVDAVLLDIQLPDLDGYEVCRRLRSDARTSNVAVIFHSAAEPAGTGHDGDAFLTYPVETSHIGNVIRGCVARRSHPRSVLPVFDR